MKRTQQGFTLIELMIVVAIIGILAAVAIPSYQDYIARAQVAEAISLLGGAKTPLEEYYSQNANFPNTTAALTGMGVKIKGSYVSTMTVTAADHLIEIQMKSTGVNDNIKDKKLQYVYDTGTNIWTCTIPGSTPIPSKYLPGSCQ